jgi:Fe-S oxidoreductase
MDPAVFWSCNTCYACVQACPVGINHVDQIVENRRNLALMHGEIPHEAQSTLRALENRANPYGDPNDRANWLEGLDVTILKPGDSVDYLYWVGCVSAYDPRKQKIARSLVTIMNHAGLSFGILGTAEGCTGDPARRLGEENLFQTLAKNNIETLSKITFKVLVANCPHCFNTIKNEYPEFGNLGGGRSPEIIHHSQLLRRLLADGKISLSDEGPDAGAITFHDPCYLGRYNDEYEAPRAALKKVKGLAILEMEESREKGLCCGAGGGHFWMDLKIGERVNVIRTEQAAATGATRIATACPFCMQMMEDGVKLTNNESALDVRDIAEVIAERL